MHTEEKSGKIPRNKSVQNWKWIEHNSELHYEGIPSSDIWVIFHSYLLENQKLYADLQKANVEKKSSATNESCAGIQSKKGNSTRSH